MAKYTATVYRVYSYAFDFEGTDAPEMIDPDGKAEFISRSVPIEVWELQDVSADTFQIA